MTELAYPIIAHIGGDLVASHPGSSLANIVIVKDLSSILSERLGGKPPEIVYLPKPEKIGHQILKFRIVYQQRSKGKPKPRSHLILIIEDPLVDRIGPYKKAPKGFFKRLFS